MRRNTEAAIAAIAIIALGFFAGDSAQAAWSGTTTLARCQCRGLSIIATSGRHGSIVAWQEGDRDALVARRIHRNGKLGRKLRIAASTQLNSREGAWLAAGTSGAVVAVWEDVRGGLTARRITRHGRLGRLHRIARSHEDVGGYDDLHADVAVDGKGTATIVWSPIPWSSSQAIGPFYNGVYARRLTAKGELGRTVELRPGAYNSHPGVAAGASATTWVAWGSNATIATTTIGRRGVGAVNDAGSASDSAWSLPPQLAAGPAGSATLAWGAPTVRARHVRADGALGPVHVLGTGEFAFNPRIAVDRIGKTSIVWRESGVVRLRQVDPANNVGPLLALSEPGLEGPAGLDEGAANIAVDARGKATAIWVQRGADPKYAIQSRDVAGGVAAGGVTTLDSSADPLVRPNIVADARGGVYAVWSRVAQRYGGDLVKLARAVPLAR